MPAACRQNPAHPRSRGENEIQPHLSEIDGGSSPLTRGKLDAVPQEARPGRLIPAHAGKTWWRPPPSTRCAAHPRSRGENTPALPSSTRRMGSSPLTRGKPGRGEGGEEHQGLIPAHAGKTHTPKCSAFFSGAHPRSRGENAPPFPPLLRDGGSSPLTRGKHSLTCAFIKRIGQILESLELCASSGSYSLMDAYATDAPQDQARNTGLALPSSRAAS